jgi:hypothetical protein
VNTKTLAAIGVDEIDDATFEVLWQMASAIHPDGEQCWSFLVRRSYLESWLKDIETDYANGHDYPPARDAVLSLVAELERSGMEWLFVEND